MKTIISSLLFLFVFSVNAQNLLAENHFEADGINHVEVSGIFCDVVVSSGSRLVVDGKVYGNGEFGDYVISSIRSGSTLLYKVERKSELGMKNFTNISGKITLSLPQSIELKVKNTSGDVQISEYASDELRVVTTSGNIKVTDVNADCFFKATSGDVYGKQITGSIEMTSTSGNQTFAVVNGNISSVATSGDIQFRGVEGTVSAQATSGNISFEDFKGEVNATTTSGNINGVNVNLIGESRFKATSGNLSMLLSNKEENVGFDLSATSGSIRLDDKRVGNKLIVNQGNVAVKGTTTSGNITFRF